MGRGKGKGKIMGRKNKEKVSGRGKEREKEEELANSAHKDTQQIQMICTSNDQNIGNKII